jgi:hypothetical protein
MRRGADRMANRGEEVIYDAFSLSVLRRITVRGSIVGTRQDLEEALAFDFDDNNAFHGRQIVMDIEGSLSTEVAIIKNQQDYNDIVVMGLALSNDGKPVPAQQGSLCGLIPKGAKNVEVAKDFLKYLIQLRVLNELLKTGLGRNLPAMPAIVKRDPWWLDSKDPHRRLTSIRACSARPCRLSGPPNRPMPRSRTSMSGRRAGPRS